MTPCHGERDEDNGVVIDLAALELEGWLEERLVVAEAYEQLSRERDVLATEREGPLRNRLAAVRAAMDSGTLDAVAVTELLDAVESDVQMRRLDRRAEGLDRSRAAVDLRTAVSAQRRLTALLTASEQVDARSDARAVEAARARAAETARRGFAGFVPAPGPADEPGSPERVTEVLDEHRRVFLLAVAHDLRSPLSVLKGFAEMLSDRLPELSYGMIENAGRRMAASAHHLDVILENLLDLERVEAGLLTLQGHEVDVAELVRAAVERLDMDDREVRITPEQLSAVIDGGILARIVENLVLNAARHTPSRRPIDVMIEADGDGVQVTVVDHGPGIPAEARDRVFDPFSGASATGGLGLGLHLVRRFARIHGGDVTLEEGPTGGAAFVVRLASLAGVAVNHAIGSVLAP